MILRLFFPQNTIDLSIIKTNFSYIQTYYNNLSPAENSVRLSVLFTENLANLLKSNIDSNIKAQIIKDNATNYFTGYIRKNISFNKGTINNPISIELTSFGDILKTQFSSPYWAKDITLNNAVGYLLEQAGIENYDLDNLPNKTLQVFNCAIDDTIESTLTQLLKEYGYTYDFNNDGVFVCNPIFDSFDTISQEFTDGTTGNLIGEVSQQVQNKQYDSVEADYTVLTYASNQLIFEDTSEHSINPDKLLYDNDNGCYCDYDCTLGKPEYIDTITDWRVGDSNSFIDKAHPRSTTLDGSLDNYGTRGLLKVKNISAAAKTVNTVKVWGSGYFVTKENTEKTTDGKNSLKETLSFIHNDTDANNYVAKVSQYYRYSGFKIVLRSKASFNYGSFVRITVRGMGQINARIIQKKYTLLSDVIEYTLEGAGQFVPMQTMTDSYRGSQNINNGTDGKDGVSTLSSTYSATSETTSIPRNTVFSTISPKINDVIIANSLLFIIKNVTEDNLTVQYQYSIKGATGADGENGVSATHSWNGTTLTITSASGTSSSNLKGETGNQGSRAIRYLGKSTSVPNGSNQTSGVPSGLSTPIVGDWYLCNNTSTIGTSSANGGGFIYYCTAISGTTYTWAKVTSVSDYRLVDAVDDLLILYKTYTDNSKTIPTPMKTICENYIDALAVGTLLANKIFAKTINIQTGGVIKSSNYTSGTTGFKINADGSVEFNNITMKNQTIKADTNNNLSFGKSNFEKLLATASNNLAIGNQVLKSVTSGNNNIGLGSLALDEVTSGQKNTGIGASALGSVTTGGWNVAIGDSAGANITTGSNNICINGQVEYAKGDKNNQINLCNRIFVDYHGDLYIGTDWNSKYLVALDKDIPKNLDTTYEKKITYVPQSKSEGGYYIQFANGVLLQWGVANVTSTGSQVKQGVIMFPIAFQSEDYHVTVIGDYYSQNETASSTMRTGYVGTHKYGKTKFKYRTQGATSSDTANSISWFAIGY